MYTLLEAANTHGGSINYLKQLIRQFSHIGDGIKFQPFKYNLIADEDYKFQAIYKKLFFNPVQWSEIISLASKNKDVWLDIFDSYSLEILDNNYQNIKGIKFQSSSLENYKLFHAFTTKLNELDKLEIIINISGYNKNDVKTLVKQFSSLQSNIIIQIGFQDYPTALLDSGFHKIDFLKNEFPHLRWSYADHSDKDNQEAFFLPILAFEKGCFLLEKHIYFDQMKTEYDLYSSFNLNQTEKLCEWISSLDKINTFNRYITEREKIYLKKTIQLPFTNKKIDSGDLFSLDKHFDFKRTEKKGISGLNLKNKISKFYLAANEIEKNSTIKANNFRKAVIGVVIACRMKSSRLPLKSIKKIGSLSAVEHCIKNCLRFENIDKVILATSVLEQDEILKNYCYSEEVIFFQGDPDNVIRRYVDVADQYNLDVVVRVTADCPFVSNEICHILLNSHFQIGADFTKASNDVIGTSVEIISVKSLKKILRKNCDTSLTEYMTYYFINNPHVFHLNIIPLPNNLTSNKNLRLTLDYEDDLVMLNKISDAFRIEDNIPLDKLLRYLEVHPEIASINRNCQVLYKEDDVLINNIREATKIL